MPVDVSADAIEWAMPGLVADYPGLDVHGVVADFERHLHLLPTDGPRLVAFLGGTIGNFEPEHRARFLAALGETLQPGDALLLGTDLVKDPGRLVRAYDDSAGVTAAFNLNVLHVVNRELGGTFDVDRFEHVAVWDAEREWIEMRLRSRGAQRVDVRALDLTVEFADGRGAAHRGVREVHRGPGRGRADRCGAAPGALVDRPGRRLRALARHRLSPAERAAERGRRTPEVRPAPPPAGGQALRVRRVAWSGLWAP